MVASGAATGEQQGVLESLALCYWELGDPAKERETLLKLFSVSSDALPGLERFIEMEKNQENWSSVLKATGHALEIQPFSSGLHQSVATASRQLEQSENAIGSLLALQAMDPVDVAGLNYQLAESYAAAEETSKAKEHLVDALLLAPRYRDAHRLLLRISQPATEKKKSTEGDTEHDADPSALQEQANRDSSKPVSDNDSSATEIEPVDEVNPETAEETAEETKE